MEQSIADQRSADGRIEMGEYRLEVDGQPRVLLCSSAFYFRIPRAEWADRLDAIVASGYHAIDVYCPWNLHEQPDGSFDFAGDLDLGAFCDLAWQRGLLVVARPGPYICSEWDGGALPARLDGAGLRQADQAYLTEVRGWFDAVLPILAERQYGYGGGVAMVQVENELDFFDCHDRTGYQGALLQMVRDHGIEVPVIACAGQGDLTGATGDVPGIVGACNFYPSDSSPAIEAEVGHYARVLAERGLPLLVTETNRVHRTLRRLVLSGARLVAPYLQTSGYDFDATPSSGNWGSPGNLMSHQYDFGGYLSSTGRRRAEFAEGRRLAQLVDTLGPALAASRPTEAPVEVEVDYPSATEPAWLALDGGGFLGSAPNLGTAEGQARVRNAHDECTVPVGPAQTPLWLVDLPLARWGSEHRLSFCSADLVGADLVESELDSSTLRLELCSAEVPVVVVDGDRVDLPIDGQATVGDDLLLVHHSPGRFAELTGTVADEPVNPSEQLLVGIIGTREQVSRDLGRATSLESAGIHRGRGTFSQTAELSDELLVLGAGDLVGVRIDGQLAGTWATFGAPFVVPSTPGSHRVELDVEIWGHANFDDSRLPLLKLGARRGPGQVLVVRNRVDISHCWQVQGDDQWAGQQPPPLRTLAGWSSTRSGRRISYRRELPERELPGVLHLDGLADTVEVQVDDQAPILVPREFPMVVLPASAQTVSVTMDHEASGLPLVPRLVLGDWLDSWQLRASSFADLAAAAATPLVEATPLQWPVAADSSNSRWLDLELPDQAAERGWQLVARGHDVRLSFWAGGRSIGRLLLPTENRPRFGGGPDDRVWVPASLADSGTVRVQVDAWSSGGAVEAIVATMA